MNTSSRARSILLMLALALGACEPSGTASKKTTTPPASAKQAEAKPARELTPAERAAYAKARVGVWSSQRKGFDRAIRRVLSIARRAERGAEVERPEDLGEDHFTILFSANNHGEREDCGCKHNPLGGLDRRATMVELAATPRATLSMKYWGKDQPEPGALFLVDAGDSLYKLASLKESSPLAQSTAELHAEAVIDAMNTFPPQAFNVGELDVVFGKERLLQLAKRASFPFISSNLLDAETKKPIFPGHVIAQREGKKVAFIGLSKARPQITGYYEARGMEVAESLASYKAELEKLPADVDLVVLLMNDGVANAQTFARDLKREGGRVDLILSSNSNRLTRDPEWIDGVPILEPMSRGKYFGRVDIWAAGDGALDYANDVPGKIVTIEAYRRLWTTYLQARVGLHQLDERLASLEIEASQAGDVSDTTPAKKPGASSKPSKKHMETLAKQREVYANRIALASDELIVSLDLLTGGKQGDGGDDWIEASVQPLAIDIPQDKKVRRVLDAAKQAEQNARKKK